MRGEEAVGNHVRWPGQSVSFQVFCLSTVSPSAPVSSPSPYSLMSDDSHTTILFIFDQNRLRLRNQWNKEPFPPTDEADVIKSVCRVREVKDRESL